MSSNVMQDLIASTNEFDASGNPKLADIGMHLKKILKQYFDRADVKYIDPTYMIRAIATTSPDRVYCKVLAHNAVHGAFAGFTGAASSEPKFFSISAAQCTLEPWIICTAAVCIQ
jgi:6-phosphofructokinase